MKTTKKRIICGTDFSQHAAEAANVAALMAARLDESMVIVHVAHNAGINPVTSQADDSSLQNAQERLHQEAERLRKRGPLVVREELLIGSPYEKLVEIGHRLSTRLIVVSSLGLIAPSRFLLGSVAERTAEHSPIPTLVVRGSASFEAWIKGERPLKVLACYDFSETSDSALSWINELRRIGPCEVTVAYVAWPPQQSKRLGLGDRMSLVENPPELQALLERDLKQRIHPLLDDENCKVRVLISWGRTDFPLIELAGELKTDLIVVGTHQRQGLSRFWLGSVSRAILHHSPISVAVVPPAGASAQNNEPLPEFKCALVTTDFSDLGNQAIPYAYSALRSGGDVCLVHVVEPSSNTDTNRGGVDSLKRQLRSLIPFEAESRGIKTQVEVIEHEEPSTAICQAAERFGADLICMASHGRSGLAKTVLGSVAQAVMSQSTRPLLVLRPTQT